ncbi:hypothetical protein CXZ10_09240 [Pleomorphomonas diazotrophica]|uniref:YcxB-like protein domain-containing protein n=1 Tax=Pleomorphomonas diazotrophica TaxID=1166257 RepID=A0A1I4T5I9_9HYPH|nr:hypothetical protein [Pleomorphomonas diazotrophica]PKR89545.1 hypothetical protein CXZ10_09240 [Pleomorphomonas diazotrophica]SFM72028.1 hypothetical protein SAMN05192571_10512 [Pleomorphomonas diazotrophica]
MTDTADLAPDVPTTRRFVFTTTEADALALEALLKPADRGWRSFLGYILALPPLVIVSWLTRDAEWPVWFAAFGLCGLAAWQLARLVLKTERSRAARRHPVGAGRIEFAGGRLEGTIGGVAVDIPTMSGRRVETDVGHLFVVAGEGPALILPLSAFADRSDLTAFAAKLKG